MIGFILGSFDTISIAQFLFIGSNSLAWYLVQFLLHGRKSFIKERFDVTAFSRKLNGWRCMESVSVTILVTVNFYLNLGACLIFQYFALVKR